MLLPASLQSPVGSPFIRLYLQGLKGDALNVAPPFSPLPGSRSGVSHVQGRQRCLPMLDGSDFLAVGGIFESISEHGSQQHIPGRTIARGLKWLPNKSEPVVLNLS
jgi:hypothetical protein